MLHSLRLRRQNESGMRGPAGLSEAEGRRPASAAVGEWVMAMRSSCRTYGSGAVVVWLAIIATSAVIPQ